MWGCFVKLMEGMSAAMSGLKKVIITSVLNHISMVCQAASVRPWGTRPPDRMHFLDAEIKCSSSLTHNSLISITYIFSSHSGNVWAKLKLVTELLKVLTGILAPDTLSRDQAFRSSRSRWQENFVLGQMKAWYLHRDSASEKWLCPAVLRSWLNTVPQIMWNPTERCLVIPKTQISMR